MYVDIIFIFFLKKAKQIYKKIYINFKGKYSSNRNTLYT